MIHEGGVLIQLKTFVAGGQGASCRRRRHCRRRCCWRGTELERTQRVRVRNLEQHIACQSEGWFSIKNNYLMDLVGKPVEKGLR